MQVNITWNVQVHYLCISSYSKTISRPIIWSLLSQFLVDFGGFTPRSHWDSTPGPRWGSCQTQTPSLPTHEKIPRAPIQVLFVYQGHGVKVKVTGAVELWLLNVYGPADFIATREQGVVIQHQVWLRRSLIWSRSRSEEERILSY